MSRGEIPALLILGSVTILQQQLGPTAEGGHREGMEGAKEREPPKPQRVGLSFPACPFTFVLPEHHSLSEQGWIQLWILPGTDKPAGGGN